MRKWIIFLLLSGMIQLAASDLSGFKDLTDLSSALPVLSENFNGGANAWKLPEGWSYEPREGITGSGALKYVRTNPKNNKEAMLYINLQPGIRYKLTLQYRSELKVEADKMRMENFAIRYWDENGKKLPGSFYNRKKMNSDNNDWEVMEFTFQPPFKMKKAALCLLMRVDRVGSLWFDDIVITPFSSELAMLHMTGPQKLTLNKKGEVSWKCFTPTLSRKTELAVEATVGGRKKRIPVDSDGVARAEFGQFKQGKIPVEAKLLDLTGKRILAVDRGNLFSRPKEDYSAPHNVEIDEFGRVMVGGKPFMPIGLFAAMIVEMKDTTALKKIKEAGFNTLLSIGYVNPYGGIKDTPEQTLRALCNELQKYDLKYIFSIKNQIELPKGTKPRGRYKWGKYTNKKQITDMTVKTLRNHPAMLAWYVSDENALGEIPAIRALRERISMNDPYHPVLTLTDKVGNFQHFAKTGDILMHDVYPVGWRKNSGPAQTLKTAEDAFLPAQKTGLPLWWVPQAFPWVASSLENLPRYPTEKEMTAQCLLAAIHGVKAFILYSWQHAIYLSEKNDPGHSEALWKDITKTVTILKELEPFIMSTEKAPEVRIEKVKGNGVKALAFKNGRKVCVPVVAIGKGNSSAEIIVHGYPNLKARFGRITNMGGGRYRFTGKHIDYDILESDGEEMTENKNQNPMQADKIVRQILSAETPENWHPSGMTRADYLDIMENIFRTAVNWQDSKGAIIDPVLKREWAQTTPRFVSSGAVLLANGRISDLKEKLLLSMDYACKEFTAPGIRDRSSDFWMRELVTAYKALEKIADKKRSQMWKECLSKVIPAHHYRYYYYDESLQKKCANWVVHSACGELLREYAGIGGVAGTVFGKEFFEMYMRWQPEHFNQWGMYLEPFHPVTYDLTTRLQFAAAFECAYNTPLKEKLSALLDKGDFITLLEIAPGGEAPFGGRSSQFYYQEAILTSLCEAAARKYKDKEPKLAGAFKRQAHLSAAVTKQGFCRNDGKKFHIKNKFPIETRHGCDDYGQFSVYSLLTASILATAVNFADDSIAEAPAPSETGGFSFAITGSFEKAFLNANGGFLQFDLMAEQKYDATGLGRIILKGMPWGLLPVLPFAAEPNYIRDPQLKAVDYAVAIAPEWIDKNGNIYRLAEKSEMPGVLKQHDEKSCQVTYLHRGTTVNYFVSLPSPGIMTLKIILDGDFEKAHLVLPILETDGELIPQIKNTAGKLQVTFPNGKLYIRSSQGKYTLAGKAVNRTGSYNLYHIPFEKNKLEVNFKISVV